MNEKYYEGKNKYHTKIFESNNHSYCWLPWITARDKEYKSLVGSAIKYFNNIDGNELKGGERFVVEGVPMVAKIYKTPFGLPNDKTLSIDIESKLENRKRNYNCPYKYSGLVTFLIWSRQRAD